LDSLGLEQGLKTASCEHANEPSSSFITDEKSFDPLMGYQLLKQNSAKWSKLVQNLEPKTTASLFGIHCSKIQEDGLESSAQTKVS
jgi:hypothetical protein